jgi:hypothetical protein
MNLNIEDKAPLTSEEFSDLRKLIVKGGLNFSDEILANAEFLHPLNLKKVSTPVTHIATAEFLFKCHPCSQIGFPIQWYQIILDTAGGTAAYQPRSFVSDLEKGFKGDNLAKIQENDKFDYQDSSLNLLESEGYMCDHCRDSIFEE